MKVTLMDNLIVDLFIGDLLLYKKDNKIILKHITEDNCIDLYDCIEILSFGSKRHFISKYPFNWIEIRF